MRLLFTFIIMLFFFFLFFGCNEHQIELKSGERIVVPMKVIDGIPLIEVKIGKENYWFFVDSAMAIPVLSNQLLGKIVKVEKGQKILQKAGWSQQMLEGDFWIISGLKIGKIHLNCLKAIFINFTPFSEFTGADYGGILNISVFKDYLVTFDYSNDQFIIENNKLPPPDGISSFPCKYEKNYGIPLIQMKIGDQNLETVIDTGGLFALAIPDILKENFPFFSGPVITSLAFGIAGFESASSETVARLRNDFILGQYKVKNPIVRLSGINIYAIGSTILKNFTIAFDQKNGIVRFSRSDNHVIELPSVKSPGFTIIKKGSNWIVNYVLPSFPSNFPINVGDFIFSINNIDITQMNFSEIDKLINASTTLKLVIKRDKFYEITVPVKILVP